MRRLSVTIVALLFPATTLAVTPDFIPLGSLPGNTHPIFLSGAHAVSADGSTVVGVSESSSGREAFRWTAGGGMVGLGDLPGGAFNSDAQGVSGDGLVVVGDGVSTSMPREAFRWTSGTGMVGLGLLPGGDLGSPDESVAQAISSDGLVIVGEAKAQLPDGRISVQPFRLADVGGMVSLGYLHTENPSGQAFGVSADGAVIVGISGRDAFRWTSSSGISTLAGLPSGARAWAVSGDGQVIVGDASPNAFAWTEAEGVVNLGVSGSGEAVSFDGSVIAGLGNFDGTGEAFIWHQGIGARRLEDVLTGLGLDVGDWTLDVQGMSADGTVLVGGGVNPNGEVEAWMAVVPLPEPHGALGVMSGLVLLLLLHRRRRYSVER